jgi:hypothetical protein
MTSDTPCANDVRSPRGDAATVRGVAAADTATATTPYRFADSLESTRDPSCGTAVAGATHDSGVRHSSRTQSTVKGGARMTNGMTLRIS